MPPSEGSDSVEVCDSVDSDQVLRDSPERPDRKRIRLRNEDNPSPDAEAGGAAVPPSEPIEQPSAGPSAQLTARPPISRRTACSGARFSELKRAFGDDASNGNWWDRRSGAGLEYLSGRSIESFPLLRPLPEFPLAGPSGEVLDRLMRLFEPELVKRMPNGVTCNVAACVDAEHALRGANTGATAYLCGHIDNFCQKSQPDARYGCGYRNIQVMMSFLTRRGQEYAQRLYRGRGIPTVHALQRSIELSWSQGFDVDGAAQLGWNLAGRDTWIGATDAAAFLRFLGFEAVLVEFSSPEAQRARAEALAALENIQTARTQGLSVEAARLEGGLHALWVNAGSEIRVKGMNPPPSTSTNSQSKPRSSRPPGPTAAAKKMLPWIYKYFSNAAQDGGSTHMSPHCVVTAAPPLYLQYQGHSTTVIGIERRPPGSGGRGASPAVKARRGQGGVAPRSGTGSIRAASQNARKAPSGLGRAGLNTSARLPGQRSLPEVMISGTGRRRTGPAEVSTSAAARSTASVAASLALPALSERSLGVAAGARAAGTCALQEDLSARLAPQNPLDQHLQPLPGQMPHSLMAGGLDLTTGSDTDDEAATLRGAMASPTESLSSTDIPPPLWSTESIAGSIADIELESRPRGAGGTRGRGGGSMTISRSRTSTRQNTNTAEAPGTEEDGAAPPQPSPGRGRHGAQRGGAGGRRRGGGQGGRRMSEGLGGVRSNRGGRGGAGRGESGSGGPQSAPALTGGSGVVGGSSTQLSASAAAAAAAEQRATRATVDCGSGHASTSAQYHVPAPGHGGGHLGLYPSQPMPASTHLQSTVDLTAGSSDDDVTRGLWGNQHSTAPSLQHAYASAQDPTGQAQQPGNADAQPGMRAAGASTCAGQETAEVEEQWEYVLYVLDPQVRFDELRKALQERQGWQKLLRRTEVSLRMPAYQVMAVRGVLPLELREQSKKLTSTRVM